MDCFVREFEQDDGQDDVDETHAKAVAAMNASGFKKRARRKAETSLKLGDSSDCANSFSEAIGQKDRRRPEDSELIRGCIVG